MRENIIQIKEGIKLHLIKTNKFKTNLLSVFITTPLNRDAVTKNALIPAILRRGTANMKSQDEISKKLEEMYGAEFDCGIEKTGDNQVIKFYLESLNDEFLPQKEELLKTSINILLEIVLNPLIENNAFKEEYLETEKAHLKQLIQGKIDNRDLYALEKCTEKMYEGKLYSLYKYGYEEDLEEITSSDMYEHYKNIINTAKIDIFISGEYDPNEIEETVKGNENILKIVDRIPNNIVNSEATEEKKEIKEPVKIEEKMDVTQGKLVLGTNIKNMKKDERFIASVYNTILGDSANSKLFQNVREKAHLAYTTRSTYVRPKNDIYIRSGIEIQNYDKALSIIYKQLEDMKNGEFTDDDIKNAKQYITSAINSVEEEQDTEITYYLGQELAGTNCSLEEYKHNIEKVTREQIQDVAKRVQINTIYFLRN
ncbi:MAG: insulinase family protein [Clostridia bacterium]|nr:insulinase family protein [Clostridia bacterium]